MAYTHCTASAKTNGLLVMIFTHHALREDKLRAQEKEHLLIFTNIHTLNNIKRLVSHNDFLPIISENLMINFGRGIIFQEVLRKLL